MNVQPSKSYTTYGQPVEHEGQYRKNRFASSRINRYNENQSPPNQQNDSRPLANNHNNYRGNNTPNYQGNQQGNNMHRAYNQNWNANGYNRNNDYRVNNPCLLYTSRCV